MTNAWNKSFAGFTTAACLMAPTVALCTESTFLLVCLHWITHHRIYIQYLHLVDCGVPSYAVLLPLTCSSYDMRLHSLLSFPLACQLCTSSSSSSSDPSLYCQYLVGFYFGSAAVMTFSSSSEQKLAPTVSAWRGIQLRAKPLPIFSSWFLPFWFWVEDKCC